MGIRPHFGRAVIPPNNKALKGITTPTANKVLMADPSNHNILTRIKIFEVEIQAIAVTTLRM